MSAPSIPNLLSLRGARAGRGGGRGRGRGGPASIHGHDATIQATDSDAAVSRLSAVTMGYLDDPYACHFVPSGDGPPPRRLPIINRGAVPRARNRASRHFSLTTCLSLFFSWCSLGTYARTTALDSLIDSFLAGHSAAAHRQIVSLGAGTDTRPFRLFSQPDGEGLIYHELDFDLVCQKKLRTVRSTPSLSQVLPRPRPAPDGASWSCRPSSGGEYYCHGLDLRTLSAQAAAPLQGLRTDVPTLVLSECCLCYLSDSEARGVLSFFTSRIPSNVATVIYEPIRPDDPFGQQMVANLAARKIHMPTLHVYREPADQEDRLRDAGLERARHATIEDVWRDWVDDAERERVDSLEGLDEVEEWKLLAAHYLIVWGSRGAGMTSWGPGLGHQPGPVPES